MEAQTQHISLIERQKEQKPESLARSRLMSRQWEMWNAHITPSNMSSQ